MDERAHLDAQPINPQLVFAELSPRLPDDCILTSDSGSATNWWARHLRLRQGMHSALSGTLATMCPAVPYALAAKFAYPERPVIASIGDGAMQMLGNAALIDLAHYAPRWSNKQCIVVVLHNNDLNQVTWEQRVMAGDPKLQASQVLPDFPFARYAECSGSRGSGWSGPRTSGRPGTRRWPHRGSGPLRGDHRSRRCRRCRRTSTSSRPRSSPRRSPATPTPGRIIKESIKGKVEEFITR